MEGFLIAAVFISIPWIILHYITRWKTAATITTDDEHLLDELYQLAKRLDERMDTVERLVATDNADFKPARLIADIEFPNDLLRELDRLLAEKKGAAVSTPRTTLYRDSRRAKSCPAPHRRLRDRPFWVQLFSLSLHAQQPRSRLHIAGFLLPLKPVASRTRKAELLAACGRPGGPARDRAQFRGIDRRLAEVETYYVTSNPRLSAEISACAERSGEIEMGGDRPFAPFLMIVGIVWVKNHARLERGAPSFPRP